MTNILQRIEKTLETGEAFENSVVYSSKVEQKSKPRPIYAADVELREALRVFAAGATRLAQSNPRTSTTYNVIDRLNMRGSAQTSGHSENSRTAYINLDVSAWSPSFKRAPHIRRVQAVSDLTRQNLPRGTLRLALSKLGLVFACRCQSREVLDSC